MQSPLGHLKLNIRTVVYSLVLDISVGVFYSLHIGRRDYIGTEYIGHDSYNRGAYHVGTQQSPVAHSSREHSDDFRIIGKFRREKITAMKVKSGLNWLAK